MLEKNIKPIIIAHRGITEKYIENTLPAFEEAVRLNIPMIEFDIRKTADNHYVIFHNEKIKGKKINNLTYAELIKISKSSGFEIPEFSKVIKKIKGKIKFDIELKEANYDEKIIKILKENFISYDDFIITSFINEVLKKIKKIEPEIKTGLLLSANKKNFKKIIKEENEYYDYYLPEIKLYKKEINYFNSKIDKNLIIWTVNKKKDIELLFKSRKIFGIITDNVKKYFLKTGSLQTWYTLFLRIY
ncbi:MAG TPA: glycerophosphodiester phosphodiesterase, partial [bacterium]|nr:glycerophosphodiester phosphodiesterase [bacterium]